MGVFRRWCAALVVAATTCGGELATTGGAFVAGVVGGEAARLAVAGESSDAASVELVCR